MCHGERKKACMQGLVGVQVRGVPGFINDELNFGRVYKFCKTVAKGDEWLKEIFWQKR